jgi:hypothetical protein
MDTLCLFEDAGSDGFYPLTETRHVSELLVGSRTLYERARGFFSKGIPVVSGRPEIVDH